MKRDIYKLFTCTFSWLTTRVIKIFLSVPQKKIETDNNIDMSIS